MMEEKDFPKRPNMEESSNRLQRTSGQTRPHPTPSTGKLKSKRTNTTTTDITTRSPISEQRPQEIAQVTYLTLI